MTVYTLSVLGCIQRRMRAQTLNAESVRRLLCSPKRNNGRSVNLFKFTGAPKIIYNIIVKNKKEKIFSFGHPFHPLPNFLRKWGNKYKEIAYAHSERSEQEEFNI